MDTCVVVHLWAHVVCVAHHAGTVCLVLSIECWWGRRGAAL